VSILSTPAPTPQTTPSQFKDWVAVFKAVVEIIAIVMAGLWTYRLFIKNRVEYPYPQIKHTITHWPLANDKIYLSVIVNITNAGNVLLPLVSSKVFVRQIRPMLGDLQALVEKASSSELREGKVEGLFHEDGREITWRELGYRESAWGKGDLEIEPGENEELQYDFILNGTIETIKVISYFRNVKKGEPEVGWWLTTVYDFQEAIYDETRNKSD
jgi:hypothetical protein